MGFGPELLVADLLHLQFGPFHAGFPKWIVAQGTHVPAACLMAEFRKAFFAKGLSKSVSFPFSLTVVFSIRPPVPVPIVALFRCPVTQCRTWQSPGPNSGLPCGDGLLWASARAGRTRERMPAVQIAHRADARSVRFADAETEDALERPGQVPKC